MSMTHHRAVVELVGCGLAFVAGWVVLQIIGWRLCTNTYLGSSIRFSSSGPALIPISIGKIHEHDTCRPWRNISCMRSPSQRTPKDNTQSRDSHCLQCHTKDTVLKNRDKGHRTDLHGRFSRDRPITCHRATAEGVRWKSADNATIVSGDLQIHVWISYDR